MTLAKSSILAAIKTGDFQIDEIGDETIQPASVDLRLGTSFLEPVIPNTWAPNPIDLGMVKFRSVIVDTHYIIRPHGFVLARTQEVIGLSTKLCGYMEGRSSVGRAGLFIHNAGFVDPGFSGSVTLELFNALDVPLRLECGRRIAQIVLSRMDGETEGYKGKYNGQIDATASAFNQDLEAICGK